MSFSIHSTQKAGSSNYKEGRYHLKNPGKYIGLEKSIWHKSKYERDCYKIFDLEPNVVRWSAENDQIKIPYYCSIDNSFHHYYPDAYLEATNKKGGVTKIVAEIKPKSKLIPPKKPTGRISEKAKKTYRNRLKEFIRIMDKKKAAEKWCADRGFEYKFITEEFIYGK